MNAALTRARRIFNTLVLAATLAVVPATTALAAATGSGGVVSEPPTVTDGFWSMLTCGFAIGMAFRSPAFVDSAAMICLFVFSID